MYSIILRFALMGLYTEVHLQQFLAANVITQEEYNSIKEAISK